jgi:serine/threonine protein kinase
MSRSLPKTIPTEPLGGRYQIIKQLGMGGFGRTYLAEDLHLPGCPQCVVKQLKPQIRSDDTLQTARRCFDTEAQVLYKLGNHDQIPRLLAHFEDNQDFYLVQEFIEGEPLTKELTEGNPWTEGQVIGLLREILAVLTFVHDQQVIHRDLKPSNLMRRRHDRSIVLIDFGAVKQVTTQVVDSETELSNLTISIGTHGYMPNEQIAGKPRFSSDIYAAGIIGIQALTGVHPKHLGEDYKGEIEWHLLAPNTSAEVKEILDRMVRYDFRDRYQTAQETLEAIASLPEAIASPSVITTPNSPESEVNLVCSDSPAVELNLNDPETESNQPSKPNQPSEFNPAVNGAAPSIGQANSADTTLGLSMVAASPANSDPQTSLTQAIGRPYLPDTTLPLVAPSGSTKTVSTRWAWFWACLAALVAVGITLGIIRAFPHFVWGTAAYRQSPPVLPPPLPSPKATPPPKPTSPAQQAVELVNQANRLRDQTQYAEALRLYSRAIALRSDFADAYTGRCETLNRLRRPEEAIVVCNDALAYKPNDPQALWSKGNALLLQNRTIEALKLYEDVTRQQPDFAAGWIRRGIALQKLGRSAEALYPLDRGIGMDRNSTEAWVTRGQALYNLGRFDQAVTSLDKALQLDPQNSVAKKLRQSIPGQ